MQPSPRNDSHLVVAMDALGSLAPCLKRIPKKLPRKPREESKRSRNEVDNLKRQRRNGAKWASTRRRSLDWIRPTAAKCQSDARSTKEILAHHGVRARLGVHDGRRDTPLLQDGTTN